MQTIYEFGKNSVSELLRNSKTELNSNLLRIWKPNYFEYFWNLEKELNLNSLRIQYAKCKRFQFSKLNPNSLRILNPNYFERFCSSEKELNPNALRIWIWFSFRISKKHTKYFVFRIRCEFGIIRYVLTTNRRLFNHCSI